VRGPQAGEQRAPAQPELNRTAENGDRGARPEDAAESQVRRGNQLPQAPERGHIADEQARDRPGADDSHTGGGKSGLRETHANQVNIVRVRKIGFRSGKDELEAGCAGDIGASPGVNTAEGARRIRNSAFERGDRITPL